MSWLPDPRPPLPAESDPLSPGRHAVEIGGLRQLYTVQGSGPVCLVHPGGRDEAWTYLRLPTLERHVTAVYVEPIGTGGSGRLPWHPDGYTRDRCAAMLHGLIGHLRRGRVHLLGHAYGAAVAQHYALAHPGRLAGLILYAGRAASAEGPAAGPHAAAFSDVDENGRPVRFDDGDRLRRLAVPTLLLAGRRDAACGPVQARELHALVPGSRLRIFEGSGQFPHLDQPGPFSAEVAGFVRRTSPGVPASGRGRPF